jgi:DNA-binding transcriptional ArsR family regulator
MPPSRWFCNVNEAISVQELQRRLVVDQPIVSQQLARLRASGIVIARKEGVTTRYIVSDPLLKDLLALAKQILNRRLVGRCCGNSNATDRPGADANVTG